jgi:hypothetical protein
MIAIASGQSSREWIKYTSLAGRYSVSLPGEPKLSTQEATSADGQKFPQYLASVVDAGNMAYMTGYFDSLPGTIFSLDAARDGVIRQIKGTLLDDTVVKLSGYAAREFKISATGEDGNIYLVRARFCEIDKRVYLLQFIVPKSIESKTVTAQGTRYFDSFQVVKN